MVTVVLVIAVGLVFAGCIGKYSSPEKTFSLLVKAMEKGDVEAYLECFTEESQELLKTTGEQPTSERLKTGAKTYQETELKVTEKTGDRATMISETGEGGMLIFKKEKGAWKIDLKETLEKAFETFPK